MDTSKLAHPKPEKRSTAKRRQARTEAVVVKDVRAACVERDGYCRLLSPRHGDVTMNTAIASWCSGFDSNDSEWAHLPSHTRAKTRGMAPEQRHATAWTLQLCTKHHDMLDGRRKPRLLITPLTPAGADGPIQVSVK